MARINISSKIIGRMKKLHGVGQPPFSGLDFSMFHYLTEAGIPYSRLHDVGGIYGGGRFVDIPNLFRDFSADPLDPASYDFTFTDILIKAIIDSGVEPFFRLGVTIENDARIKSYRLDPPSDPLKWAKICEGVIRHYTEGFADGFYYDIKYWEIWNEPDSHPDIRYSEMWKGTKEQYYELYGTASRYLKNKFPHLRIGGYASCGVYAAFNENPDARSAYFIEFMNGFLEYVRENDCPLDFFSWHTYSNAKTLLEHAEYIRKKLDEYGFCNVESILNEWNPDVNTRGSAHHAAQIAAAMIGMQDSSVNSAMFYDARFGTSIYGGMFNPLDRSPFPAYYSFVAYNELYRRGSELYAAADDEGIFVCAAGAHESNECAILIANISGETRQIDISVDNIRINNASVKSCRIITDGSTWREIAFPNEISNDTVLCVVLDK